MNYQRALVGNTNIDLDKLNAAKDKLVELLMPAPAAVQDVDPAVPPRPVRHSHAVSTIPTENTMGVGIGEKITSGKQTGILCLKILVRMKFDKRDMLADHLLPVAIDGIPTDVEEVGIFRPLNGGASANPRTRLRPAQPGCSIGFRYPDPQFGISGTFGALVKDDDGLYVLSNNHVLADEGSMPVGSPIFQPSLIDSGRGDDVIAELSRFVALDKTSINNTIDGAIAKVLDPALVSNQILHIGAPQGVQPAAYSMQVHKYGRTTGYTVGQITSLNTTVAMQYENGTFQFSGQLVIAGNGPAAFAGAGDSGALILERSSNLAVGLLMGGSDAGPSFVANHLVDVLAKLNVTLA